MVRVLPLIPQVTFDGAGRRRVLRAHGCYAGRAAPASGTVAPPAKLGGLRTFPIREKPSHEVPS